jgi:hypothetical protein
MKPPAASPVAPTSSTSEVIPKRKKTSAWLEYCKFMRPHLKQQHPHLANSDMPKHLSDLWKALSEADRAPWLTLAEGLNAGHVDAEDADD